MAAKRPNPTLSDDLISEILVRVPVKSLLRFKAVSKTWLSLITNPCFVKAQLAITTLNNQTLITTNFDRTDKNQIFLLLDVDSYQIEADLKFPGEIYTQLVGSANGIVCVTFGFDIYLWNPAIRQYKVIPLANVDGCVLGFGYDAVDDDFKVVRFLSSFRGDVYSNNQSNWRDVPQPMDISYMEGFDVCINGFLCGIGKYGMMAFDLNQEVLNCAIRLPNAYVENQAYIIEFNKSVAVIVLIDDNESNGDCLGEFWTLDKKINLWTLDDDACLRGGVEASWTLIFSIYLGAEAEWLIHGYFTNGNLLLMVINDNVKWILCNADKKEAKIVPISVVTGGHQIYKYTESLVSLAGFRHVNWNADEDDN